MYLPVSAWLIAFLITLVVEVPIAAVLLRRSQPSGWRLIVLLVFANLATHPAVWFIFPQLFYVSTPSFVIASEAWAVAAEAVFYMVALSGTSLGRAIVTALVANGASFLLGVVVMELWPQVFL